MQLQHPDENQKYDRVVKDKDGNELWGYRTVYGEQEIVHLPSGTSNMKFWQREMVSNPEGCQHSFKIEDIGRREVVCTNSQCNYGFTFHPKDIIEDESGTSVVLRGVKHSIS